MKIYRPKLSSTLPILLIPILFSLSFIGSNIDNNDVIGILGFFLIAIILTLIFSCGHTDVDGQYVKSYLFGFLIMSLTSSNVKSITYGNLFKGGLGYGKGLIVYADINGKKKRFSMG